MTYEEWLEGEEEQLFDDLILLEDFEQGKKELEEGKYILWDDLQEELEQKDR